MRALEINDSHALGHFARGYALRYAGMLDESELEMRIALSLDSTDSRLRSAGHTFNVTGDYEDALRAYAVDQESPYYYTQSAEILQRLGEQEKAIQFYRKARELDPRGIESPMATAYMSGLLGDYEAGTEAIRKVKAAGTIDAEQQFYIAAAFCFNQEVQTCNKELRKAVEMGYFNVQRLESDFFLDAARGTNEFEKTLALAREKHQRFKEKYFPD
jgi:tetratricopeptide (TPR) repeat protein